MSSELEQQVFLNFQSAISRLHEVLQEPESQVIRDATIQRFEFTYELAWKSIKRFAQYKGLSLGTPRDAFKFAFKEHLIDDQKIWLDMVKERNLTTHAYNEATAHQIFEKCGRYAQEFEKLWQQISKELSDES